MSGVYIKLARRYLDGITTFGILPNIQGAKSILPPCYSIPSSMLVGRAATMIATIVVLHIEVRIYMRYVDHLVSSSAPPLDPNVSC